MTHLYLARHGETEENVAQILQGLMPGHLTARGREQAAELRDKLVAAHTAFDVMLTSDLQRALDTANIINGGLHLPLSPCPLLRERDWGSFTGTPITIARSSQMPDDAESVQAMFERAKRFINYIYKVYHNQSVLAIGHGLFNRTIQAAFAHCEIRDIPRMQNAECATSLSTTCQRSGTVRHMTLFLPTDLFHIIKTKVSDLIKADLKSNFD